jgi:hypothetical protein
VSAAGIGAIWTFYSSGIPGFPADPAMLQRMFGSMPLVIALVLAVCCSIAAYLVWQTRETLAVAVLLVGFVPAGLAACDGSVRLGQYFSLASAANFLNLRLGENGEVLYEGPAPAASSLRFHLDRPFRIVGKSRKKRDAAGPADHRLSRDEALEQMAAAHPVYLIIHKDRASYWQRRLTERFHIYHQVTTCGEHAVLNNHP